MKNFLTEEERSKILELRDSSLSIYKISREIHRSRKTVSAFIKNPEEYIKEMDTYLAMSPEVRRQSIKPRSVNSINTKPVTPVTLKKFLTEAEREKINIMRDEGKSISTIAQSLGRGTQTIRVYTNEPDGYEDYINKSITEHQQTATVKKKLPNFLAKNSRLKILKLKENGLSPSKIAKKLRKSHESVVAFLKNPDEGEYEKFITSIKTEQTNPGNFDFESKFNGTSKTPIKRYLTEEERSKIQEMREQNNSLKTIAKLMHRSLDTINAYLKNPKQYEEEVQAYKEFRLSRKSKPKSHSYKMFNNSLSEEDLKYYNKVSIEHRSVIKFLVRKGATAKLISGELKKVYGKSAPDMNLITYWAEQFKQGRQTILNESKSLKTSDVLERPNGILSSSINNSPNTSNVGGGSGSSSGGATKKPPVKLKLFQFKLKPSKN